MKPYYQTGGLTLYHGDCREILPALDVQADVVIADPPYAETSLAWDRWPDGWPAIIAAATRQMWCFGSMRMFLDRRDEFTGWRLAQDIVGEHEIDTMVWEKHNGSSFAADRFRRVHELATHWYRGPWAEIYQQPQQERNPHGRDDHVIARRQRTPHTGDIGSSAYTYGTRLVRSVIRARSMHRSGLHPTEKPAAILRPLVGYSCPPGGLVLDPFAGSGSALAVARELGMRAIGIEADEHYCEVIAGRLAQGDLFGETA